MRCLVQDPCAQNIRTVGGFLERPARVLQTPVEVEPLAVELNLLRAVLTPELTLDVGRELMVRVAQVGSGGRGMLSLAGVLLEAELPPNVAAGQELRLVVRELTPQKVVLTVRSDQQPSAAGLIAPILAALVPMPGGGALRVEQQGGRRAARLPDGGHSVKLRYDAPHLGAIDMHFTLAASGGMRLSLLVSAGEPLAAAEAAAAQLQDRLQRTIGAGVALTVAPRREPLEVYA